MESVMKNYLNAYCKGASKIAYISGIFGTLSMGFLVLMTVCDVFLRFFFNKPILGSFEITEYAMIPIIFFAIPWATQQKANVRVELFIGKIRKKPRAVLYSVTCAMSVVIAFALTWFTVPQSFYIKQIYIKSDMLKIPAYPFYFITALGLFILFIILVANLIEQIEEAVSK